MKFVGLFLIGFITFSSCELLSVNNKISPEQIKAEETRPFIYLDITGDIESDRITCQITNIAQATTYKNIDVTVHYFRDNRELIRSDHHILQTTVGPKSSNKHIIAITPPPLQYSLVYYSIKDAEVVPTEAAK